MDSGVGWAGSGGRSWSLALLGLVCATVIPACASTPPSEERCDNAIDDDGDGLVDCRDPACASASACERDAGEDAGPMVRDASPSDGGLDAAPDRESSDAECTNGMDDDGDLLVDCDDPDCIDVSLCIDAGPPRLDGGSPADDFDIEHPALSALAATEAAPGFPTYLAHLFGPTRVRADLELRVACVRVHNEDGTAPRTGSIAVRFEGYASAPGTATYEAPAGGVVRVCADPPLDLAALRALDAPAMASIEVDVLDADGALLARSTQPTTVLTIEHLVWERADVSYATARDATVVLVEPSHASMRPLALAASARSRYSTGFFAGGDEPIGYLRLEQARPPVTLAAGGRASEVFFRDSGEAITLTIAALSGAAAVDVAIYTEADLARLELGESPVPLAAFSALGEGASASWGTLGTEPTGWMAVVISSASAGTLTWSRTNTREDVVRDVLAAIWAELEARGDRYAALTTDYFRGATRVHRVSESASGEGETAIDAALLGASLSAHLGLDAVLFYTATDAYFAIRAAPGDTTVWPLALSRLGSGATFFEAYRASAAQLASDRASGPTFRQVDLAAMRMAGLLPAGS